MRPLGLTRSNSSACKLAKLSKCHSHRNDTYSTRGRKDEIMRGSGFSKGYGRQMAPLRHKRQPNRLDVVRPPHPPICAQPLELIIPASSPFCQRHQAGKAVWKGSRYIWVKLNIGRNAALGQNDLFFATRLRRPDDGGHDMSIQALLAETGKPIKDSAPLG